MLVKQRNIFPTSLIVYYNRYFNFFNLNLTNNKVPVFYKYRDFYSIQLLVVTLGFYSQIDYYANKCGQSQQTYYAKENKLNISAEEVGTVIHRAGNRGGCRSRSGLGNKAYSGRLSEDCIASYAFFGIPYCGPVVNHICGGSNDILFTGSAADGQGCVMENLWHLFILQGI